MKDKEGAGEWALHNKSFTMNNHFFLKFNIHSK